MLISLTMGSKSDATYFIAGNKQSQQLTHNLLLFDLAEQPEVGEDGTGCRVIHLIDLL